MQLSQTTHILLDCYFDSERAQFVHEPTVLQVSQETGLIHKISPLHESAPFTEDVIDLRGLMVLPGLVDTHVHRQSPQTPLILLIVSQQLSVFLHPYTETSWEDQLTKESLVERTIRASTHANRTLLAGFTTVRQGNCIVTFV
jgi:cytosine/adenosine deaminase-related metal-dependent hydrolase